MKKQQKIQLTLVSIGVFLILLTYFYYPYMTQNKLQNVQLIEKYLEKTLDDNQSTTFENVSYEGITSAMQKFSVKSSDAYILSSDPRLVYMKNMRVEIYLNDSRTIVIVSDLGRYNKESHDTWFEKNVVTNDGDTKIFSQNLDLLATENFAKAYNKVKLDHPTGLLSADQIDYDFETKYFTVKMFSDDKRVKMKVIKWVM